MSTRFELEVAIQEAFFASEVAHLALAVGLGFENGKPPVMTQEKAYVVFWCFTDLKEKIRACHEVFFASDYMPADAADEPA